MSKLTYFYLPSCPHCRLAARYLEELKSGGVNDAFIVAYRNDEQIPVDEARSLEKSRGR